MELKDNPLLKPENYMEGYAESIASMKNKPELVALDKLCYEVFNTPSGQKLMELIHKQFLIPSLADRNMPNYSLLVIWADGFKDFARMLISHITSHEQRIASGNEV